MSMEFFNGFTWAIPKAFSDAIAACKFEEGDILYDSPKAYEANWGEAVKHINHHIQVREPARGTSVSGETQERLVFNKNWNSEVYFQLVSHKAKKEPQFIRTTQGKLYSALWHSDLSVFDDDQTTPDLPLQLKDVSKKLTDTKSCAKKLAGSKPVFVMARDLSNPISRNKHSTVKSTLHLKYGAVNHSVKVADSGIKDSDSILPTIDIVFFVMERGEYQEIHDALKAKLYTPGKDTTKDMFRLNAHGLLIAD